MFKELRIVDFRGITELELEDLRPVTLLVGKNNCGKTTVLESLFVMINPSNLDLFGRTNAWRGLAQVTDRFWRVLFRDQNLNRTISLDAVFENPQERRHLSIEPTTSPMPVPTGKTTGKEPTISVHDTGSESVAAVRGLQATLRLSSDDEEKEFNVSISLQDSEVKAEVPKDYKEPRRGVFLNPSNILTGIAERFDRLLVAKETERATNVLREIEPRLSAIHLGAGNRMYCDIGSEWLLPLDVMGGGMKNVLAIILAMYDMKGGTVLVDEIENGLHPVTQQILWRTVFEASREFNTQVIASTHSIECVKAFSDCYSPSLHEEDEIRLYRIEREQDHFKTAKFDHTTLRTALESGWEIR